MVGEVFNRVGEIKSRVFGRTTVERRQPVRNEPRESESFFKNGQSVTYMTNEVGSLLIPVGDSLFPQETDFEGQTEGSDHPAELNPGEKCVI